MKKHCLLYFTAVLLFLTSCGSGGKETITPDGPTPPAPDNIIIVSQIILPYSTFTIETGENRQIIPDLFPESATDKTVTWESSDTSIATVSNSGVVYGKSPGTVNLIVKAGRASTVCQAIVKESHTDLSFYDIQGGRTSQRTTANCYVVSKPGKYKIPVVYGNAITNGKTNRKAYLYSGTYVSYTNVLEQFVDHLNQPIYSGNDSSDPWVSEKYSLSKGQLLWQDSQNLVTDVYLSGGQNFKEEKYLCFEVKQESFNQGNAVVAVYCDNIIAWSWHIWITDSNLSPVAVRNQGNKLYYALPVNLGWCEPQSAKSKNGGKYGNCPYYQYGRKDPMLPSDGNGDFDKSYYGKSGAMNDGTWQIVTSPEEYIDAYTAVGYTVRNPFVFLCGGSSYSNLWSTEENNYFINGQVIKSVYDPSPSGYCVPPYDFPTGFARYVDSFCDLNCDGVFNNGYYFYTDGWKQGEKLFLPAIGERFYNGILFGAGDCGYYHLAENLVEYLGSPRCFYYIGSIASFISSSGIGRGEALPVRSIKEY